MGKQSRQKPSRRGRPAPERYPYVDLDPARMGELATLDRIIGVDGDPVPVITPRLGREGGMEFDSEVCKAGVKKFARARVEGDWPAHAEVPASIDHVLVEEIVPGARRRLPLTVVLGHAMN